MTGLPRKYARMGFAKGWRAYRASTSSQSRGRKKAAGVSMAKRRKSRSRSGFKSFAKRGGVGNSAALLQVDAMAYGALRSYASDLLKPVTSMIPLGTLSDEVGMAALNYFVAKNTSGMARNIAMKGLVIENARVGEALVQGGLGVITGSTSGSQSGYLYG